MTPPRFSIALATYNGERFLEEQLESLVRQTLLPHELVVCDDASTDATVSILKAFAAEAPFPVRICQNEQNLGYGDNFIKAASLCEGDWIAFCDQDDVWLSHKLKRLAEVIGSYEEVIYISHSAMQVDEGLQSVGLRMPDHPSFQIISPLQGDPFRVYFGFSCCIRREILQPVLLCDRPVDSFRAGRAQSHDAFIYHVASTYGHIALIPDILALYRRHRAAVTGSSNGSLHERSVWKGMKGTVSVSMAQYARRAMRARQHSEFYRAVQFVIDEREGARRKRTEAAIDYYDQLESFYANRAEIYRDSFPIGHRVAAFINAWRQGAYRQPAVNRRMRGRALLKDVAMLLRPAM